MQVAKSSEDIESLKSLLGQYQAENEKLKSDKENLTIDNINLRSLIFQLKKKVFGSSSEVVSSVQLDLLFDEAETSVHAPAVDETEEISYKRKKKGVVSQSLIIYLEKRS